LAAFYTRHFAEKVPDIKPPSLQVLLYLLRTQFLAVWDFSFFTETNVFGDLYRVDKVQKLVSVLAV
jgi:hypothetical protein